MLFLSTLLPPPLNLGALLAVEACLGLCYRVPPSRLGEPTTHFGGAMALSVWKCLRSALTLGKKSCFALALFALLSHTNLFCQTQPPQSDPQAISFADRSVAALTSGSPLSDVTLTGTATWSGRLVTTNALLAESRCGRRVV